jgi:hypothetical protein
MKRFLVVTAMAVLAIVGVAARQGASDPVA